MFNSNYKLIRDCSQKYLSKRKLNGRPDTKVRIFEINKSESCIGLYFTRSSEHNIISRFKFS